jgi:hypothetical protein
MTNTIKPQLLELVDAARATKQAFIDGLSDAQRDEVAPPGEWAARDHVAHVTFWEDRYVLRLVARLRGEAPPPSLGEDDEVNARVLADQHARAWPDLEAEAARVYAALLATIQEGSEALLTGADDPPAVGTRPVWAGIADSVYDHSAMHYADYYRAHGDLPRATQVREGVVATLARLFPGSAAYSNGLYNLGCFYALTGQPDKAIPAIGESLALAPHLTDWSTKDSDLDSLRDLPAFQALYPGQPA